VSVQSIAGLLALNLVYCSLGALLVWAARLAPTWTRLARYIGVGYLVAVALVGVIWGQLLVLGVPFSGWSVAIVLVAIAVGALVAGWWLGRPVPAPGMPALGQAALVPAAGIVATAVFLEALFRAGRLQGVQAYDAWAFWLPKATMIYETGGLDVGLLRQFAWSGYPQLVPTLDAIAFHAMGSRDLVTLHLQFWCFAVGFVWAVAGLLSGRARHWILWPFLLLALVAPRVGERLLMPQADFLLDYLTVTAAVCIAIWLLERDGRWLAPAAVLLAGAMLTKREGLMLAACILVAAALASVDRWRHAWARLGLVAAFALAAAVPWRVWVAANDLAGEGPRAGLLSVEGREGRLEPAVRLSVEVLFDQGRWSLLPTLAVGALVVGLLARQWRITAFVLALVLLVTLGATWATWAFTENAITDSEAVNPIVRTTAATILMGAALVPLVLSEVWNRVGRDE
jgi:hypothetical protein